MVKTRYGNASINNGYYMIRNNEHGFRGQLLHRLIMAEQLGCGIPKNYHVHHIDGDRANNNIDNLQVLSQSEHSSLHKKGVPNSLESNLKLSKTLGNSSGYFKVTKKNRSDVKQGFIYVYYYYEDGKRKELSSVDINKLEDKVKSKGLEWVVFQ